MSKSLTSRWESMRPVTILSYNDSEARFLISSTYDNVVFVVEDKCYFYSISARTLSFSPYSRREYNDDNNDFTFHSDGIECKVSCMDSTLSITRSSHTSSFERDCNEMITQYFMYYDRYYSVVREISKWYIVDLLDKSRVLVDEESNNFQVWSQKDKLFFSGGSGITMYQ